MKSLAILAALLTVGWMTEDTAQAKVRIVPKKAKTERRIDNAGEAAEAKIAFRAFMQCQAHLTENTGDGAKNLRRCTREYLSGKLPEFMKRDYEQFLFFDLTISELYVCDPTRERQLRKLNDAKDELILCFDVYKGKSRDRGYVFFEKSEGRPLLSRLNFSVARLD